MASFRVNLQHDTQRLSHRIKFCMQRSLVTWSSQTHRWFTLDIHIVPLKLMELWVCLSIYISIFRNISIIPIYLNSYTFKTIPLATGLNFSLLKCFMGFQSPCEILVVGKTCLKNTLDHQEIGSVTLGKTVSKK